MNSEQGVRGAEIIRAHKDTWASVRIRDYIFMLCIGAAGASSDDASVVVVDMAKRAIVFKSDDEIINMIRETSDEVDGDVSDDDLMYDFAGMEYM